jgi:hypothetical protein
MALQLLHAGELPAEPLDAAAHFHARLLPSARDLLARGGDLAVVFNAADHTHAAWRLAAIQELAREAAPLRVNAIVGDEETAVRETAAYLDSAPGVTGQILTVDAISGERH